MNDVNSASVNLNREQRDTLMLALKGTNMEPINRAGMVTVTKDDVEVILAKVQKLHDKERNRKVKTAQSMENSYNCQVITTRLTELLPELGIGVNDNKIGLVDAEEEVVETTDEVAETTSTNEEDDAESFG